MSGQAPGAAPRFLEWDSGFFGVRIASLAAHGLGEAAWQSALSWCRSERIECLYLLSDESDREVHARAEAAGALRVDERISLSLPLPSTPVAPPDPELRLACEADIPALRHLAAISHTNSRFWKDPGFARDRCAELYAIWIERDVRGHSTVFVPGPVGAPVGYVTPRLVPEGATIGLLAVAESARRRGLGTRMMLRSFELAREAGFPRVDFITQGPQNIALKLYESLGASVQRVEIWHHLWFPKKA